MPYNICFSYRLYISFLHHFIEINYSFTNTMVTFKYLKQYRTVKIISVFRNIYYTINDLFYTIYGNWVRACHIWKEANYQVKSYSTRGVKVCCNGFLFHVVCPLRRYVNIMPIMTLEITAMKTSLDDMFNHSSRRFRCLDFFNRSLGHNVPMDYKIKDFVFLKPHYLTQIDQFPLHYLLQHF